MNVFVFFQAEDGIRDEPGHAALHKMLVGQNEAGCLLCLLSKNEESDIREVFRHDTMAGLDWSHWAAVRVDWSSKPSNLRNVCERLGLGLDSVLFLDANPVEDRKSTRLNSSH